MAARFERVRLSPEKPHGLDDRRKSTAADRLCAFRRCRVVSEVVRFAKAADRIDGGRPVVLTCCTDLSYDLSYDLLY
jgi:hypothetical protein